MDIYNDTTYNSVPDDNECVVNAVQIGKRIEEPPHTIRMWAEEYEDYLYIKKINGRFTYTEASVSQFEFIKRLRREKDFGHAQIKEQIRIHGFNYNNFDGGLITEEGAVAIGLSMENKRQMKEFLQAFMEMQNANNDLFIENLKNELSITVQESVEIELKKQSVELNNTIKEELSDTVSNIENKFSSLEEKIEDKDGKSQKLIDMMTSGNYEIRKKGMFNRLFRKERK